MLLIILFFLLIILVVVYFFVLPGLQKNTCDLGPQQMLSGKTCKEISNMAPNGQQINAIGSENWKKVGYKYAGEDCWFSPLGNCISKTCINNNTAVNEELLKCYVENKIKNGGSLNDPGVPKK